MHPELHRRRQPRTVERLKLLYVAVAVSWLCTLVWWLFNVEPTRGKMPPPHRRTERLLVIPSPPPAPNDPVSRAWRLRNEVLVDEHERSDA